MLAFDLVMEVSSPRRALIPALVLLSRLVLVLAVFGRSTIRSPRSSRCH
jgi:hypothetical protein